MKCYQLLCDNSMHAPTETADETLVDSRSLAVAFVLGQVPAQLVGEFLVLLHRP